MLCITVELIKPLQWTFTTQNTEVTQRLNAVEPKSITFKSEQEKTMTVSNILCDEHDCVFKDKLRRTEDNLLHVKSQLAEKENIMAQLRENLHELSCNLQTRDMLVRTQEKNINLLQNSLKIEQEEGRALRSKICDMEAGKTSMMEEYSQKIEEMEAMIMKLQDSVKSTDEASLGVTQEIALLCKTVFAELLSQYELFYKEVVKENTVAESLRDINLELAILAGQLHHKYQQAKQKLSDCYKLHNDSELKAEKVKKKQLDQEKVCLQHMLEKLTNEKEKDQNTVKELHKEIAHYQKEVSRLMSQVSELQASHQQSSAHETGFGFNDQSLHKRVNDLSEELACMNEENNKLALENELVVNKMQSGGKISEIHKQRIEELRLALDRKTNEMQQLETSQKRYFKECLSLRKELRQIKDKMCKMQHEIENAKQMMMVSELAENEVCALKEKLAQKTNKLAEITEVAKKAELELEMRCKEQESVIDELSQNVCKLSRQVKIQSERCECRELELSKCQDKLKQAVKREERVHQEVSNKETELQERIHNEQKRVCQLTDEVRSLTKELSCIKELLEQENSRHTATQQILQKTCLELDEVKGQLNESNTTVNKLQGALTHLSMKVVTQVQKLEAKDTVIKEKQEQLAQLECLLKQKIEELKLKDQQIEELKCKCSKIKQELETNTKREIQELQCRMKQLAAELEASRRNEECHASLLDETKAADQNEIRALQCKVKQLNADLESARRNGQCHADFLNEQTQKLAQKDEKLYCMKVELEQCNKQNNDLEEELKLETAEVTSLEEQNCKLMQKLQQCELCNKQLLCQVNTLHQLVCDLRQGKSCQDVETLAEQREISLQLASEVRHNKKQLKALARENSCHTRSEMDLLWLTSHCCLKFLHHHPTPAGAMEFCACSKHS